MQATPHGVPHFPGSPKQAHRPLFPMGGRGSVKPGHERLNFTTMSVDPRLSGSFGSVFYMTR